MIYLILEGYWGIYKEYLVPKDTTKPDQFRRELHRLDRNLPAGHRFRGDVGTI